LIHQDHRLTHSTEKHSSNTSDRRNFDQGSGEWEIQGRRQQNERAKGALTQLINPPKRMAATGGRGVTLTSEKREKKGEGIRKGVTFPKANSAIKPGEPARV